MRILFITTAHNSLSQRLSIELTRRGHAISLCVAPKEPEAMLSAVHRNNPDLILAPFLKTAIPERIWRRYRCLIVHPGITGDRGPSSLDWAITLDVERWGVTVLEAVAEMDAGPIWASETFTMPRNSPSKSALYRAEVAEAAVRAVLLAVARVASGTVAPEPLDYNRPDVVGQLRPPLKQRDRAIDWSTDTAHEISRKVRAADSTPGVLTTLMDQEVYVYGAHQESHLSGPAGYVIAQRHGAVCVATSDGALWLTHMKRKAPHAIKLPATCVLDINGVPHSEPASTDQSTYRDIRYWERGRIGYLSFDFYNGAMNTEQCRRLLAAYGMARSRPTDIICLLGGRDFWSNGIDLNTIESAGDPARESWRNINAIDDLVLDILTTRQLVVSALRGNAGAGGVMLALAADQVYARRGVVLNPHYRTMGNLYGSEYWTYTLPRRVGADLAKDLTTACQPIGVDAACDIGLLDEALGTSADEFQRHLDARLCALAADTSLPRLLADKQQRRSADEHVKPLARYRAEELAHMAENFFGPDKSYHEARHRFVHKLPQAEPVERGSLLAA
jgi:putative two-component system hydrogenase maturation factor HypX/HoxX